MLRLSCIVKDMSATSIPNNILTNTMSSILVSVTEYRSPLIVTGHTRPAYQATRIGSASTTDLLGRRPSAPLRRPCWFLLRKNHTDHFLEICLYVGFPHLCGVFYWTELLISDDNMFLTPIFGRGSQFLKWPTLYTFSYMSHRVLGHNVPGTLVRRTTVVTFAFTCTRIKKTILIQFFKTHFVEVFFPNKCV